MTLEGLRLLERAARESKSRGAIYRYFQTLARLGETRGLLLCPWCLDGMSATIHPSLDYADCKTCGARWTISSETLAPAYPSAGQRVVEVDEPHRRGCLGLGTNRPRRGAAWVRVFFDGGSPNGESVRVRWLRAETPLDKT